MAPNVVSVPFASQRAPKPVSTPMQVPISGNRKSAHKKNPYINPAPSAAPSTAPTIPIIRLYSPASFGFRAVDATGRTAVMAAGAEDVTGSGAGSGATGAGAGRFR